MSHLTKILIGGAAAIVLLAVVFVMIGNWGSGAPESEPVEMSYGSHLVTVRGHYQEFSQELLADGLTVTVDGHKIAVTENQVSAADGLTRDLEPGQNVDISVDEKGAVQVNVGAAGDVGAAAEAAEAASE